MNGYTGETSWVIKSSCTDYPKSLPPIEVDISCFSEAPQMHSMSGYMYPDAGWICCYDIIGYSNELVVPWKNGKPFAGFTMHDTRQEANKYIKLNTDKFSNLLETHPELFV
jgi:hypothetical protein